MKIIISTTNTDNYQTKKYTPKDVLLRATISVFLGAVLCPILSSFWSDGIAQTTSVLNTIKQKQTGELWNIKLADNDKDREVGLMFVEHMEPKTGMLFRFNQQQMVYMWMKNTIIPLDMVFIDNRGVVRHIHYNAMPQSLDTISSQVPVKFVLEINAGEAQKYDLNIGDEMIHQWFER